MVGISRSSTVGMGSILGQRAKIPRASWPRNQSIKQKPYCNKFSKDFKNGPNFPKKNLYLKKKKRKKARDFKWP